MNRSVDSIRKKARRLRLTKNRVSNDGMFVTNSGNKHTSIRAMNKLY